MSIVLISENGHERAEYFLKSARELGVEVEFIPYPQQADFALAKRLKGKAVKIDPPAHNSADLGSLVGYIANYKNFLTQIKKI